MQVSARGSFSGNAGTVVSLDKASTRVVIRSGTDGSAREYGSASGVRCENETDTFTMG